MISIRGSAPGSSRDPSSTLSQRPHESLDPSLLAEIASDQGTPVYVYDARILDAGVRRWVDAVGDPARVCYAVKANHNLGVLARLASHGINSSPIVTPPNATLVG